MAEQSTMPRAGPAGRTLQVCGEHGSPSMTKGTRTTFGELEMRENKYFPGNLEHSLHTNEKVSQLLHFNDGNSVFPSDFLLQSSQLQANF